MSPPHGRRRGWSLAMAAATAVATVVALSPVASSASPAAPTADANPGTDGHPSRNSGEPGYKASADYVASVMKAAGYNVTLQEYKFHYTSFVGDPVLREESPTPHSFGLGTDFNPAKIAGSARAK